MLLEFKKAKLTELQERKDTLEAPLKEIETEISKIESLLEEKFNILKSYKRKYSFIEAYFTKRNEYQESLKLRKEYEELYEKKEKLNTTRNDEYNKISFEIMKISEEKDNLSSSNDLFKIGYSLEDIMSYLESKNISIILSEEDKIIVHHERDYSSKKSLISVHKTNYYPENNEIKSTSNSNVYNNRTIKIDGKYYPYTYKVERNTVHTSLNTELTNEHGFGNWLQMKYSILIPFADIPSKVIAGGNNVDMFSYGNIPLPKTAWILCPQEEVAIIKEKNPHVHVIGYNGENVSGYSKAFLSQLGYRCEDAGMWDWQDDKSAKEASNLMQKENIAHLTHSSTYFKDDEDIINNISRVVALSKCLKDNNLINNKEDLKNILDELGNNTFEITGFWNIYSLEENDSPIRDDEITRNNRQIPLFLEKMHEVGLTIPKNYQTIFNNIATTKKIIDENGNYVFEDTTKIFTNLVDLSEEEKATIELFKQEINKSFTGDLYDKCNDFLTNVILNTIKNSPKKEISKREETIEFLKEQKEKIKENKSIEEITSIKNR